MMCVQHVLLYTSSKKGVRGNNCFYDPRHKIAPVDVGGSSAKGLISPQATQRTVDFVE